jgi:hypothetical protein
MSIDLEQCHICDRFYRGSPRFGDMSPVSEDFELARKLGYLLAKGHAPHELLDEKSYSRFPQWMCEWASRNLLLLRQVGSGDFPTAGDSGATNQRWDSDIALFFDRRYLSPAQILISAAITRSLIAPFYCIRLDGRKYECITDLSHEGCSEDPGSDADPYVGHIRAVWLAEMSPFMGYRARAAFNKIYAARLST